MGKTKLAELYLMLSLVAFVNWFTFELVERYGTIIPKEEVMWITGVMTGIMVMFIVQEYKNKGE